MCDDHLSHLVCSGVTRYPYWLSVGGRCGLASKTALVTLSPREIVFLCVVGQNDPRLWSEPCRRGG